MARFYEATDADGAEKNAHWRLRVEQEDGELTFVAEERATSNAATAVVFEATTFQLTEREVRWLHAALGKLVAGWDVLQGLGLDK